MMMSRVGGRKRALTEHSMKFAATWRWNNNQHTAASVFRCNHKFRDGDNGFEWLWTLGQSGWIIYKDKTAIISAELRPDMLRYVLDRADGEIRRAEHLHVFEVDFVTVWTARQRQW